MCGAGEMQPCTDAASARLEGAISSMPANKETVPSGSPLGGLSSWGSESGSLPSALCWLRSGGRISGWPQDRDSGTWPAGRNVLLVRSLGAWEGCGERLMGFRKESSEKGTVFVSRSSACSKVVLAETQEAATGGGFLEVERLWQRASNCRDICLSGTEERKKNLTRTTRAAGKKSFFLTLKKATTFKELIEKLSHAGFVFTQQSILCWLFNR